MADDDLRARIERMADRLDRLAKNAPNTYAGIRHAIAGELRTILAESAALAAAPTPEATPDHSINALCLVDGCEAHGTRPYAPPTPERAGAEEVLARATVEAQERYKRQAMHVGTPSDRERAAFVAGADYAAGLLTPPTGREDLARAWDEGYRRACSDHSTWCKRTDGEHGQEHANPYAGPVETGGEGR